MSVLADPILFSDQHLTNLDEHAKQASLDIEMTQLDAGVPRARIAVIGTSNCTVLRGEYDRSYHQSGHTPGNILSLGIPDSDVSDFRWCDRKASGDQVINFSLDNGFDGTCGAGFSGFAISLRHDLLLETLESLELNVELRQILRIEEVLPRSETLAKQLRYHILAAFGAAQYSSLSHSAEFFNYSAAALILNYLTKNRTERRTAPIAARHRAARASLQYLEDVHDLPVTVSQLCSKVGVSAPTLYRSFHEQYGVSPKQYMQFRRLCGVRQQILSGDDTTTVGDVANKWDFWHMGQFAADYRKHFGELPSETLAKAKHDSF